MKQKCNQYRPVWVTLLVTLVLAWLSLLPEYHVPGLQNAISNAALNYSFRTRETAETVQQQKVSGNWIVTYRSLDRSWERGAVVFEQGWNGLWRPILTTSIENYPMDMIQLQDEKGYAVYAVDCPEEAIYWGFVPSGDIYGEAQIDLLYALAIPQKDFILHLPMVPGGARLGLFDAEGNELPTLYPGSGSMGTSGSVCKPICILILLAGAAVALVHFVRLRRKAQTLRQEADGACEKP